MACILQTTSTCDYDNNVKYIIIIQGKKMSKVATLYLIKYYKFLHRSK